MKNETCILCQGSGFYSVANGADDFDMVECDCKLAEKNPLTLEGAATIVGESAARNYGINPYGFI